MARLTRRATVLLGCSLILAFVTACGIGSDPKPADRKHRVRLRYNNTGAAAPSDSLLPGGTYRTPELPQTADRHGSEGWLHPGASRAIVGAGTH
jgi:hypothetical protein